MVSTVVSSVAFVVVPFLVVIGLIRKYREYKWGWCTDYTSLQGKVFIVTGANSGIGRETAKALAIREARVILACRDLQNANKVIADIRETVTTGELIPMKLDLASLASIHTFSNDVIKDFPRVHTLINNAGVSVPLKKNLKTEDGFEINFGVNHLGHFALTNRLLPVLKQSTPSRIIIVSSLLHEKGEIDFDNLYGEKGWDYKRGNSAYATSKLANVYFGLELAKRLENTGVDVFTVCPGFCRTKLFRFTPISWWKYVLLFPVAIFFMRSAKQGCQTTLHCALSDVEHTLSGQMFRDCKLYKSHHPFNPTIQNKLWDVSEKLTSKV